MGQSINSIKEFEQRSPQLGYISSFNTCSHVKSSLMHNPDPPKIMHERDFYMGTCLEGDSAHSLAWRGPRGDLWRSAVGMTLCHFSSLTRLRKGEKRRYACYSFLLLFLLSSVHSPLFELSSRHRGERSRSTLDDGTKVQVRFW